MKHLRKNQVVKKLAPLLFIIPVTVVLSGCWVAAAGVGAESGYVAAQPDRTTGETIDDQMITASVKTKLLADQEVSGLKINVDTFKGVVTMRGYVPLKEQDKAIQLARSVTGVKEVVSKMVVE